MIAMKDATVHLNLTRRTLMVFKVIIDIWEARAPGINPVLTSANDGTHMKGSKHYTDEGWDWRTNNLPRSSVDLIAEDLRAALGPSFDIVIDRKSVV